MDHGAALTAEFFRRPALVCAQELIGCVFHWHGCTGRIVETEAYEELDDPACHAWSRPSTRHFIATHDAGAAYVYLNYGVHWLFNVLTKCSQGNGFVLFRALEPLSGMEEMRARRGGVRELDLCNGPGKLSKALDIKGDRHGGSFLERGDTGIFKGESLPLITGPRIGISKAMERPWRFGAKGSVCLSKKF